MKGLIKVEKELKCKNKVIAWGYEAKED